MPARIGVSDDGCCCGNRDTYLDYPVDSYWGPLVTFADRWDKSGTWEHKPSDAPIGAATADSHARLIRRHVCEESRWGWYAWRSTHWEDRAVLGLYDYRREFKHYCLTCRATGIYEGGTCPVCEGAGRVADKLWAVAWYEEVEAEPYYPPYVPECPTGYRRLKGLMEVHLTRGGADSVLAAAESVAVCVSPAMQPSYFEFAVDPRNKWAMFRATSSSDQWQADTLNDVWPRELRAVVAIPEGLYLGTPFVGPGKLNAPFDGSSYPRFMITNWQMAICFGWGNSTCNYESTDCDGKCTAGNPWMRPINGQVHNAPPEFEVEIAGVRKGPAPDGYQLPRYVEIGPPEGDAGPDGGTFSITLNGETTAAIDYDADGEYVRDAIADLAGATPADVAVYGDAGGPWIVTFADTFAVSSLTVAGGGLTGGTLVASAVRDTATRVNGVYPADMLLWWRGWYQPAWELFPESAWLGISSFRWREIDSPVSYNEIDLSLFATIDSTDTHRYLWVFAFAHYDIAGNSVLNRRVFRHAWRKEIPFWKNVAELQDFALDHRDAQCTPSYPGLDNNYLDWSQATCKITAKLP